jgi:hypothetical protein
MGLLSGSTRHAGRAFAATLWHNIPVQHGLLRGLLIALLAPAAILPIAFTPRHAPGPPRSRPPAIESIASPSLPAGGLRSALRDPSNNPELAALFAADQGERKALNAASTPADWAALAANDEGRRARVAAIVATGGAETGADWYMAAMVYQHGGTLDDYARAREYAITSVLRGDEDGRWLAAAAWDRWLVQAGYPQRFGTQSVCDRTTGVRRCHLSDYDPTITDDERSLWDVPPLAASLQRLGAHP